MRKLAPLLFCLILAGALPAHAIELFGFRFFERDKQDETSAGLIDPKTYTLTFQTSADDVIAARLKGASQLWLGRERPVAGNAGLTARAKADYRRIQAALYNEGFYGGLISIEVAGIEASDLTPGTIVPDTPEIVISVEPGPLYRFGEVRIENPPGNVPDKPLMRERLVTGEPAKAGAVRGKRRELISDWRLLGHAKARISNQRVTANHQTRQITVSLVVDPGPKTAFGVIAVEGVERMDADFVARHTGIKAGGPFNPRQLEKADQRLSRLEVFSTQKFEEAEHLEVDETLPITLTVKERKLRRIGLGATVSNVDGAGLEAFWLHRNLFGQAERLRVTGEISGLGQTVDLEELDYLFDLSFKKPGVIHPDIDFDSRFTAKREFNDTFEETSLEGEAGLTYLKSDTLTLSGSGRFQVGEFDDAFGTRDLITVGLVGTAIYDKRDDTLEPTKGFYLGLDINPFYELEFENAGVRFDLEGRTYLTLDTARRFTLAARTRLGSLVGPEREETASDLLFFTGGGGSVRGFGFKTIGVAEDDGDVTGGRSFIEGSFEARFRATDTIGGVAFVDAGAVSEDSFFDFEDGASVGVGLGARYYTSIGAIRADVAVPINGGPDDPPVAFYAGIGQTF
ncbi:MAG: autotransporter assembly complex family protein [Pseudomonadota bacterium]